MRFQYIVFPQNVSSISIMNKFDLRRNECLVINKLSDMDRLSVSHANLLVFSVEDEPHSFTYEYKQKMYNYFDKIKYEEDQRNQEVFEKELKKWSFCKISDLKNNDKIVFRDRENPNMYGEVTLKNNKIYINDREYFEDSPFYQDIRIIQPGDEKEDYFLGKEEDDDKKESYRN